MEARTRLAPCQSPSGALTGCATKRAVFDSASRPIPSSLCPSRRSVGKSGPEPPSSGSFCFVCRQQAACDQRQLRRFVLGQMLQRSLAVALPDLRKIRQQLFGYSLPIFAKAFPAASLLARKNSL